MPVLPEAITSLVSALARLPGIGPRSAERIALHLVQADQTWVKELAGSIVSARERVGFCQNCGALTEQSTCETCADPRRDPSLICVVERPVDIFSVEKSGTFKGKYHVLGGKVSPLNGVEPEDLSIASLERRLAQEPVREVPITGHIPVIPAIGSHVADTVCSKLGQLQPKQSNILLVGVDTLHLTQEDVRVAMLRTQQRAERNDPAFFQRYRFRDRADFFRYYQRLSEILLRETDSQKAKSFIAWVNPQARIPLPSKVRTVLYRSQAMQSING